MRNPDTEKATCKLGGHIGDRNVGLDKASQAHDQGNGGIELCARYRARHRDQHEQNSAGRQRVSEHCDGDVTAGKPLGDDAGADHRREQPKAPEGLGKQRANIHAGRTRLPAASMTCSPSSLTNALRCALGIEHDLGGAIQPYAQRRDDQRPVDKNRMRHHCVDERIVGRALIVETKLDIRCALFAQERTWRHASAFDPRRAMRLSENYR